MSVLVVAEHLKGQVRDVTYELVTAARSLGGPVAVAVVGPEALDVNREGIDEVVHVQVEQAEFENDVYQRALERLIEERKPDVVLLGFTVLPDWPTWRAFGTHPASTIGRDTASVAPSFPASSSNIAMFSCSPTPRPIESKKSAVVMSTSPFSTSRNSLCRAREGAASSTRLLDLAEP